MYAFIYFLRQYQSLLILMSLYLLLLNISEYIPAFRSLRRIPRHNHVIDLIPVILLR